MAYCCFRKQCEEIAAEVRCDYHHAGMNEKRSSKCEQRGQEAGAPADYSDNMPRYGNKYRGNSGSGACELVSYRNSDIRYLFFDITPMKERIIWSRYLGY